MVSRIKVEGLALLRKNSATLSLNLDHGNKRVLMQEARTLRSMMRSRAPVKSGILKQAIVTKKWKDRGGVTGWVVGITKQSDRPEFHPAKGKGKKQAYYPASQEYGTDFHPAHSFIRAAWDMRKNMIRSRLRTAYKSIIQRARG